MARKQGWKRLLNCWKTALLSKVGVWRSIRSLWPQMEANLYIKVFVAINIGSCCVKVDDNGSGVLQDGLVLMGERYVGLTSFFLIPLMLLYIIFFLTTMIFTTWNGCCSL